MRHGWIVVGLFVLASPAFSQEAATISFAQNHSGTHPRTISGDATIKVDLSALPSGVAIHRAVLRPGRVESEAFTHRDRPIRVTLAGGDQPLRLLPPRF